MESVQNIAHILPVKTKWPWYVKSALTRHLKKKFITANLTLSTMASFVLLVIVHTPRIACGQTHTQDYYCNTLCVSALRIKNTL